VRSQLIDAAQVQRLSLTLGRAKLHPILSVLGSPPPVGTPLPPGYHLAYFTPAALESGLGSDGTDKTFNPVEPFVRRMWAGGSITWTQDNPLRVGDIAEERTTLVGAVAKKSRSGHEMVFVEVGKAFSNSSGLALTDMRYVATTYTAAMECTHLSDPGITGRGSFKQRGFLREIKASQDQPLMINPPLSCSQEWKTSHPRTMVSRPQSLCSHRL
jgi:hydroxyacyl-ACP dehydratase HTD2-like protein with hotdog domain